MRSLMATLSAIRLEYETSRQQFEEAAVTTTATTTTTTAGSSDASNPVGAEAPAVAEGPARPAVETAAVPTAVESTAPIAVVAVPDGPTQDRSVNRERTPPPPPPAGSRAKAIAKMSSAELAGPRKGKKAGASATAEARQHTRPDGISAVGPSPWAAATCVDYSAKEICSC